MRRLLFVAASTLLAAFVSCSDDDGSNVVPNGPPGAGTGGGGAGGSPDAGPAGTGGSGAGRGGTGGGGAGGSGGSAGCTPVSTPDAGTDDAGVLDAGSTDGGLDASTDGPPSGVVSFAQDIHPIFEQHCGTCHVSDGEGGHNVGGMDIDEAYEDAVGIGQRLVTRVNGGGMPPSYATPPNDCGAQGRGDQPGDPGCLTVSDIALIQSWIDQCYPR